MYQLNVTGDEGEASTYLDLADVEDAVRRMTAEWLFDEGRGMFGYGDGDHPCEDHESTDGGCEACLEAETEAAEKEIAGYVTDHLPAWMRELETDGSIEIRVGSRASGDEMSLWYRLREEDRC